MHSTNDDTFHAIRTSHTSLVSMNTESSHSGLSTTCSSNNKEEATPLFAVNEEMVDIGNTSSSNIEQYHQHRITTASAAISAFDIELLTPYPYTPTTEEVMDYHQLEQSLGEDWSFRLACELSTGEVSMDDDYSDDHYSPDNESISSFYGDDDDESSLQLLPEDIEVRTYNSQHWI